LVQDTLPLAEVVHRSLVWLYCNKTAGVGTERNSAVLLGKDDTGRRLEGHEHAYYLPTDEDGDGRIDHVTVTAAAGFGERELRALDRLRRLRWREGEPLRLLLTGLGAAADFRAPVFARSRVWVSATPFIVTRYPKRRGRKRDDPSIYANPLNFAGHVLWQELGRLKERRAELPEVVAVETLHDQFFGARRLRSIQFQKYRRKTGDDGGRRPSGAFRITFADAVRGPICLGHSSHFGLGLFVPESQEAP
jgi:CRISPR-associated protein Csb2